MSKKVGAGGRFDIFLDSDNWNTFVCLNSDGQSRYAIEYPEILEKYFL